jgi:carbamate kinase
MKLLEPDHRQATGTQGMEAIVDRDISNALLMGSMSFSC